MRRVIAISDLHLGGEDQPMLGHPEVLTAFLHRLTEQAAGTNDEIELVINGDFVDFLAEQPSAAWTEDEAQALSKLERVFKRSSALFDALGRCAQKLRRFTLLLGNHDIELAYPRVRDALMARLGTEPHRCLFLLDNEAYRVGDLLIEHGNRYDAWNAIDHDGLRQVVSAASRGELALRPVEACPGSRLVHEVINPLKRRYHFVDLLKPEDKLVTLLLTALEPTLKYDLPLLFHGAAAYASQHYRKSIWSLGGAPRRLVARDGEQALPDDVERAFAGELNDGSARQLVGVGGALRKLFLRDQSDSLHAVLARGEAVEDARLGKLQAALRARLAGDATFDERRAGDAYAAAAAAMSAAGAAKVIVMGHTHLARDVPLAGGGRYLNTGTWADLLRLDPDVLRDTGDGRRALEAWLRKLVLNDLDALRSCEPRYADVRVNDDGRSLVGEASLRRYSAEDGPA